MNILVIEDEEEASQAMLRALEKRFEGKANIVMHPLIQHAIELLEKEEEVFDLIVFGFRGTGNALIKVLLQLGGSAAYVMSAPDNASVTAFARQGLNLESAVRTQLPKSLEEALDRLKGKGLLAEAVSADSDYIPLKPETLAGMTPVKVDIFVRLGQDRYVRLFKKGSQLEAGDIEKYCAKKQVQAFYVKKSDSGAMLQKQKENLEALAAKPDLTEEESDKASTASIDAVRDIVDRVGFSGEAQAIAKSSVAMTLKVLGKSPKLGVILEKMKINDGQYITAHSLTLGKVACAMAHKVGWSSAATFLKLSLAAFLHDLPLKNNDLAKFVKFDDVRKGGKFTQEEIKAFKDHPIKAAEFARQFHEIPPDVDTILVQHHERPDGTGFPRGMSSRYIAPLSCLFIMAHDLMHFMLENPGPVKLEEFFKMNEKKYDSGQFKKILKLLQDDANSTG